MKLLDKKPDLFKKIWLIRERIVLAIVGAIISVIDGIDAIAPDPRVIHRPFTAHSLPVYR
ncbi:MAG: hypothetical protein EA001_01065 [Oscillatoriales cyanobacterium]|nr:MAG: hypothetical protein EA001_01065 [Oscillatoriales cyanobacterium]